MKIFRCNNCGTIFDDSVAVEGEMCPVCQEGRLIAKTERWNV
jgi:rubrerythrin